MNRSEATDLGRKVLDAIPSSEILELVDELDLRPNRATPPMFLVPLRSLKQRRDVAAFAKSAPSATLSLLFELYGHEALNAIIEGLGDNSENPTYEQLHEVVTGLLGEGAPINEIRAVCAHVALAGFPAADHCARLLSDVPSLALA